MFIPPAVGPFILRSLEEEGDNGGGNVSTDSESYFDELGVPPVQEDTNNSVDGENPAPNQSNSEDTVPPQWGKLFEVLPSEFQKHPVVRETLSEWDKNFARVQSEYAPYKPLLENKVSMDDIQNSIELTRLINSNPKYVYEELGKRFGFATEQGQQQVENQEDEDDSEEIPPNLLELENNPTLKAMQEKLDQFQQMFEQQEAAKREETARITAQQEIQTEWDNLYKEIGVPQGKDLPQQVKNEIIRRSVAIGDETGTYSLKAGYQDYSEFVNYVRNSRANNTAPTVMPGNGALPSTKKNLGQMDEGERVDHIAAMAKALAEGNGS